VADKLWKKVERKVAEFFGFRRVPVAEQEGFDVLPKGYYRDVTTLQPALPLGFEVKEAKSRPKWFVDAFDQAERHAAKHHGRLLPAVVFAEKGSPASNYVVAFRLRDFEELLARLNPTPPRS
jgi:hypothetical protein